MQALADSDNLAAYSRGLVDDRLNDARQVLSARREEDLKRVEASYAKAFRAAEAQRDERLRKINEVYASRMVDVQTSQQRDLRNAIDEHDRRMADLQTQVEARTRRLDEKYHGLKEQIRSGYETTWRDMAESWRSGMQTVAAEIEAVRREIADYCPAWDDPAWPSRVLPRVLPPVLRFGEVPLDLAGLPDGVSTNPRLMEGLPTWFALPGTPGVSRRGQPTDREPSRRPSSGCERPPGVDVKAADQLATGPGPIHDHRSRSASAVTSGRSCTWPTSTVPW